MRFCPFCAKENSDEEARCIHCGKRLPGPRRASVMVLVDGDGASPSPPALLGAAPTMAGAAPSGDRSTRARRETVPTDGSDSAAPAALAESPSAATKRSPPSVGRAVASLPPRPAPLPIARSTGELGAIDEATSPGSSPLPRATRGAFGKEPAAQDSMRHTATAPGRARADDTAPSAVDSTDRPRSAPLADPAIEPPPSPQLALPAVHHATLHGVFSVDPADPNAPREPEPERMPVPPAITERNAAPRFPVRSAMPAPARSALRSPVPGPVGSPLSSSVGSIEAPPPMGAGEPPLVPTVQARPSARSLFLPPLMPSLLSSDEEMATIRMPLLDAEEMVRSSLARAAEAEATPLPAPSPAGDLPQPLPPPPLELDRPWNGGNFLAVPEPAAVSQPLPPELAGLPPMPSSPSVSGPWGAVRYLFPVARAWWSRRGAQAAIRTALVGDQRALDQVLGELGRAARDEGLSVPAVRDEMLALAAVEERRAKAESETLAATEKRIAELERFGRLESACDEAIVAQEAVARRSAEELRAATDGLRSARSALGAIDAEIHSLERKLASQQGRAAAASPDQRGALEAEVLGTREQVGALGPRRDDAAGNLAELEPPIAKLTDKATEERDELVRRKRALAATTGERQETIAALDARLKQLRTDGMTAAAEISRRHVTIGTLLNLNRVERDRFLPLYARIDELKGDVTEREALIARLEQERQAFDHAAVQQGLIALAAGVGGMAILIVVLLFLRG